MFLLVVVVVVLVLVVFLVLVGLVVLVVLVVLDLAVVAAVAVPIVALGVVLVHKFVTRIESTFPQSHFIDNCFQHVYYLVSYETSLYTCHFNPF